MLWGTEIFNGAEQIRKPLISCTIQFIYRCKWKRKCRHNLLLRKSLRRSAIDQESVLEKAQIEDILRFHVKYGMLFLGSCGLDHVATLLRNFRRSFSFPRNKHIFFCLPAAMQPQQNYPLLSLQAFGRGAVKQTEVIGNYQRISSV